MEGLGEEREGMRGVGGCEREEEGSGEETVGKGVVLELVVVVEEGEPPMMAFSEMRLLVPNVMGWVVVVRRTRGWTRLCSPKVMGWVPRM